MLQGCFAFFFKVGLEMVAGRAIEMVLKRVFGPSFRVPWWLPLGFGFFRSRRR